MDEIIYVIVKVQFDFALEVWFSIQYWFKTSSATGHTCIVTAFYGDLVYKFKKNCWKTYFSDQFK